jgi:predicted Zn-dependent peptidase
MYGLACSWYANVSDDRTTISISGLDENIGKALDIVEDLLANAVADEDILESLKADELRGREVSKLNQRACQMALANYLRYGPGYVAQTTLPSAAIAGLQSEELLAKVREMFGYAHTVLYYGPSAIGGLQKTLAEHHKVASELAPLERKYAAKRLTDKPEVLIAQYDARQFNYTQYSNRGESFDITQDACIDLFNEYFGGGMNTIVFQEMRESRALAYSAGAYLAKPVFGTDTYSFSAMIGSQNDKLRQAVEAFDEIIEDMPKVPENFDIAKTSLTASLRTRRTIGNSVLYSYLESEELGLDEPREKYVWDNLDGLTMDDLVATHEKWVKGRTYAYSILGDTKDLDMDFLRTLGPVKIVTLEEIFGY